MEASVKGWVAVLTLLAGCASASTPTSVAVEPVAVSPLPALVRIGPMEFDCDTLADHFSKWELATQGRAFVASGTLRFQSELPHPNWLPSGLISLSAGSEEVRVHATAGTNGRLAVATSQRGAPATAYERRDLQEVEFTREPLPFEVRARGAYVELALAGARVEVTLRASIDTFTLHCNTGNVVFESVYIELQ